MTDTKTLVKRVRDALDTNEVPILRKHNADALAALSELEARLEALRLMQDDKLIARVQAAERERDAAQVALLADTLRLGARVAELEDALREIADPSKFSANESYLACVDIANAALDKHS